MSTLCEAFKCLKLMMSLIMQNISGIHNGYARCPTSSKILSRIVHNEKREIPKTIWIYWNSQKSSNLINSAVCRIKELNPDHTVNLLNDSNLQQYLGSFNFHNSLSHAHRADLIRLMLLCKFGGIWVDATTLCYSSFAWVHAIKSADLIGFYRDCSTIDYEHPVVESWFLASPKNNRFLQRWLEVFSEINSIGSESFSIKLRERDDYKENCQHITHPDYLMINICHQIASRQVDYNYLYKKAEDGAFYFQRVNNWSSHHSALYMMINEKPDILPEIIKLTHGDRELLPIINKLRLLNPKSIIGEFLAK